MNSDPLYTFLARGLLAEEALDRAGRKRSFAGTLLRDDAMEKALSLSLLDDELAARAGRMALVYMAIATFENSARDLVSSVLLEGVGVDWWNQCVSEKIRKKVDGRRKEEAKYRWHSPRGGNPIEYTDFGDLGAVIEQNWPRFEPYMLSVPWVHNIFDTLERSRNVIMHSGSLEDEDVGRIGIHIRDWVKQVG